MTAPTLAPTDWQLAAYLAHTKACRRLTETCPTCMRHLRPLLDADRHGSGGR